MTEKRWFTNKNWFVWAPLALVALVLFVFLGGTVVMLLWNWLLPPLFGWGMLNFWQALGILLLSRILLGGFGSHGPRWNPRTGWHYLAITNTDDLVFVHTRGGLVVLSPTRPDEFVTALLAELPAAPTSWPTRSS